MRNIEKDFKKHSQKCHKMFSEIIEGKEFYARIEREITQQQSGEMRMEELSPQDSTHIRVSILSDEIISYDSEMFGITEPAVLMKNYRPYFVSFLVPFDDNVLEDIDKLGSAWYVGRLVDENEVISEEETVLNGVLEVSASPVNFIHKKRLLFINRAMSKAVLDKINKTYDITVFTCADNKDVQDVLNTAWNMDFPQEIDVYNIGHGNCDYIRGRKKRILYDVGYDYRHYPAKDAPKYPRATKAIRQMKPSCVILSHWDLDHFIGCAYADQDLFSVKWIAPHLESRRDKKKNENAMRLANYLRILGNLYLVDRDRVINPIAVIDCKNKVKMKMWLGSGRKSLSYRNIEGLMIEIEGEGQDTKNNHVLLAGDVPYDNMPSILNKKIDFMHVPHHCSKMNLDKLEKLPGKGKGAVISTNRGKLKGLNYHTGHHKKLEEKFCEVIHTVDHKPQNDEANLCIRYNYKNNDIKAR